MTFYQHTNMGDGNGNVVNLFDGLDGLRSQLRPLLVSTDVAVKLRLDFGLG